METVQLLNMLLLEDSGFLRSINRHRQILFGHNNTISKDLTNRIVKIYIVLTN